WEGSGNIQCLDVLLALARAPATGQALWNELHFDAGPAYTAAIESLRAPLPGKTPSPEASARRFVESLALALQASALLSAANPIAQPFVRTRLATPHLLGFGTLLPDLPLEQFNARAA